MSSANRRLSRTTRIFPTSPIQQINNINTQADGQQNIETHSFASLPKHIPFPEVPYHLEFVNELFIFVFTIVSAGAQFMHLYRTVWWLPDSYTSNTMNLYLIDPYLAVFMLVILGRRLIFCLINKLIDFFCPGKFLPFVNNISKFFFFNILVIILGGCTVKIYQKHNYMYTICLCYPLVLYAAIFGLHIEPFLRTISESETVYFNRIPLHCCSTNPNCVRSEVDALITDFNNRFKQVIFTSVVNAYYAGFIPCFFAQKYLFYDVYWTIQHLAFIWTGVFAMGVIYCFPAKYSDVLHRSALHLGQWTRVEGRPYIPPAITWSKTIVWPAGTLIKHSERFYKSVGPTAAIPANSSHYRFYTIFQNPAQLYLILTGLQLAVIIAQILILFFVSVEWHNTISLTFLLFVNHTTLFKMFRDYLVTQKVYTAESSIYKKITISSSN